MGCHNRVVFYSSYVIGSLNIMLDLFMIAKQFRLS